MKRLLSLLCAALPFFASCNGVSLPARDRTPHPAIEKDLLGKRFVLQAIDGNTIQTADEGEGYELGFNESMQVYAKGCNRFFGKANLENGVLTAPQAASTRMYCAEKFSNDMDNILSSVFSDGAQAVMERGKLKLTVDSKTLTYIPSKFKE